MWNLCHYETGQRRSKTGLTFKHNIKNLLQIPHLVALPIQQHSNSQRTSGSRVNKWEMCWASASSTPSCLNKASATMTEKWPFKFIQISDLGHLWTHHQGMRQLVVLCTHKPLDLDTWSTQPHHLPPTCWCGPKSYVNRIFTSMTITWLYPICSIPYSPEQLQDQALVLPAFSSSSVSQGMSLWLCEDGWI